jgi:hypothetical protein
MVYVTLCGPKRKRRQLPLAHLVLEAFVGPRASGLHACHFPDRDPWNCSLSNLRWDTAKANKDDARKHGTIAAGSRNGQSKLSDEQVALIRSRLARGESARSIAKDVGVSRAAIRHIKSGKTWRHVAAS